MVFRICCLTLWDCCPVVECPLSRAVMHQFWTRERYVDLPIFKIFALCSPHKRRSTVIWWGQWSGIALSRYVLGQVANAAHGTLSYLGYFTDQSKNLRETGDVILGGIWYCTLYGMTRLRNEVEMEIERYFSWLIFKDLKLKARLNSRHEVGTILAYQELLIRTYQYPLTCSLVQI